ncbi:hypothetical protein KDA11_01155 [Candidatus Saccharibacteria bacterium]|nr:hypothetical protein [Candidatus Saccharibacteria bacterium]
MLTINLIDKVYSDGKYSQWLEAILEIFPSAWIESTFNAELYQIKIPTTAGPIDINIWFRTDYFCKNNADAILFIYPSTTSSTEIQKNLGRTSYFLGIKMPRYQMVIIETTNQTAHRRPILLTSFDNVIVQSVNIDQTNKTYLVGPLIDLLRLITDNPDIDLR